MIVDNARDFLDHLSQHPLPLRYPVACKAVMMMAPQSFYVAAESAQDNRYMRTDQEASAERAYAEQRRLAELIAACGIPVFTVPGVPDAPDAIFPNNVWATVPGKLIVGAMKHGIRQREARREDLPALFARLMGYDVVDLSTQPGCVAELTGALIVDRGRNIGYHGMTERLNRQGVEAMHQAFGLELSYAFDLDPSEYHTNVVMSVLASKGCVIDASAVCDGGIVDALHHVYEKRVIELLPEEKAAFAGNCIALSETDLFMSQTAADTVRPEVLTSLESWGFVIRSVALEEVEKAGGSLRCMTAEVY